MAGRGGDTIREFSFLVLCITACTRVQPAALKKKKSHNPQATGQNKSENCGPTTGRIDSAAVGQIKGIPIHPSPSAGCTRQTPPNRVSADSPSRILPGDNGLPQIPPPRRSYNAASGRAAILGFILAGRLWVVGFFFF